MNKKFLISTAVMLLVASAAFAAPASKEALSLPVSGSFIDSVGGTGSFAGTFKLTQFAVRGDQIVARGVVMGTLTDSTGTALGSVAKSAELPVSLSAASSAALRSGRLAMETNATCDILHLELGPIHLDLLGLVVNVNQIVIDIDAESGQGNLLGNLLCAVVSLLDGPGALVEIARLLNQILGILSGLLG